MIDDPYVDAHLETMNVVLLVDGIQHIFVQLCAEGVFDDRKDRVGRIYCETKAAMENPILEPTETYDIADLIEGLPDCIECLARIP
jgi:hypothetical protein